MPTTSSWPASLAVISGVKPSSPPPLGSAPPSSCTVTSSDLAALPPMSVSGHRIATAQQNGGVGYLPDFAAEYSAESNIRCLVSH
eukprot:3346387-Rhodomonas_salina.2